MDEIQPAKGAIRAGTELLLREADIEATGLDDVVVAGALGTYLDPESATGVGLLVDVERASYRQVGNAAGRGVEQLPLSRERRALVDVARSLVAYERGAVGPGRNCAYENVYLKAITVYPMTLEGAEAARAHLSPVGNIAKAAAGLRSNESVQNIKLLGGMAPTVSMEQLAYATRLLNEATKADQAILLREGWWRATWARTLRPSRCGGTWC
ncbi:MAG: methyltransferase MtaB domain-containing protein [Acidimicrobiales bacterium]